MMKFEVILQQSGNYTVVCYDKNGEIARQEDLCWDEAIGRCSLLIVAYEGERVGSPTAFPAAECLARAMP